MKSLPLKRAVPIAILLVVAISLPFMARHHVGRDTDTDHRFVVTSAEDSGPGSLREALFAAARGTDLPEIELKIARIKLATPLPPLIHAKGFSISSTVNTIIEAPPGNSPVLEIRASPTTLTGFTVRNASGSALLALGKRITISKVVIEDSDIGLVIGGNSSRIAVDHCTLQRNRIGIQVLSAGLVGTIGKCSFSKHREAGFWMVLGKTVPGVDALILNGNTFAADYDSVVVANATLRIEQNSFADNAHTSITAFGSGATLVKNRIRTSAYAGILVTDAEQTVITGNEIDHNKDMGIFLKNANGATVDHNRIYANGYGLVLVFQKGTLPSTLHDNTVSGQSLDGIMIVGASPVIRGNSSQDNHGAGLKILDATSSGKAMLVSNPQLESNVLTGNSVNAPLRGRYAY